MSMHKKASSALSVLSGMGVGAGLMYLFDPDAGKRRRRYLGHVAEDAYHDTRDALGHTLHSLAERSRDLGHSLSSYAHDHGDGVTLKAREIAARTREIGDDLADRARRIGNNASRQARSYRPNQWFHREDHSAAHVTGYSLTALGFLAVGFGAMYLFDPQQGNRRRALIRNKFGKIIRETGHTMRLTGRHLSDKARGLAAETRSHLSPDHSTDEQLSARVRSNIGRVVSNPSAITVSSNQGCLTLSGNVLRREMDALISTVRSLKGVHSVENHLTAHDHAGSIPDLQGIHTANRPA